MSSLSSLSVTTWATQCSEAHHVKEILPLKPQRKAQVCNPRTWEMGAYRLRFQGRTWQGAGRGRERRKKKGERGRQERKKETMLQTAAAGDRRCWGNVRSLTSAARDTFTKGQNIKEHYFLKTAKSLVCNPRPSSLS